MAPLRFPNETADYRGARDELLKAEIALVDQIEKVAAMRRALPAKMSAAAVAGTSKLAS